MRRRVWLAPLFGALVTLLALAVVAPTQAWAESKSVGYNDGSWNGSACEWTWKTVNAEILDDIDSSHYTLNSGWYVMTGDWGDGDRPTVSGTVNIIMEDGTVFTSKKYLSTSFYKPRRHEDKAQSFWFDAMDLPETGRYRVAVVARNCFGGESAPIFSRICESVPGKSSIPQT